jgi:hypothetical protein
MFSDLLFGMIITIYPPLILWSSMLLIWEKKCRTQ